MSELRIYKASAGSGKTYRLAGEYIDLVFRNPDNYRAILAVTFTNKASAEMKGRIIEQLYNMSIGNMTGYTLQLKKKYKLDDNTFKKRAEHCLKIILHDFSRFSVETIDSFSQKIILAFIREIGLQVGYKIELDTDSVLEQVTEELLYKLDENKELKKWLINYAESKIEEGKSWNIKNEIIQLGKELFKESFKISRNAIIEKISDKDSLKEYISRLIQSKKLILNKLTNIGNKALKIIKDYSLLPTDFSYGQRGIGSFFEKLANGIIPDSLNSYVLKCIDNEDAWYSKSFSDIQKIIQSVNNGLMELLIETVHIYEKDLPVYHTTKIILSVLPVLGIISDLSKEIRKFTTENNSFLISDTAEFLYQIIGNNDSPFIYEKTGNYYKYYMIDEFQDTSRLQWHNFKPLVINSLAENRDALFVGDVKQSIYRWRNSDWKILAEEVNNEFQQFRFHEIHLNRNWRSADNIIHFNNSIFQSMANCLQDYYNKQLDFKYKNLSQRIKNVYGQLEQTLPPKKEENKGYVEIKYFSEENFREDAKKEMLNKLIELRKAGYQQKDIAILVRSKKDGKEIADFLINPNYKLVDNYTFEVISNDSLYITSCPAIRVLLFTLKFMKDPNDFLNLFSLVVEYLKYIDNSGSFKNFQFLQDKVDRVIFINYLPDNFEEKISTIINLSVYEIVEYLVDYFSLYQNVHFYPYLQAFKDMIYDFSQNKTANLSTFLEWWDTIGINKTISINEQQNAIKIITIHKSKGLQFRAVLVPFCNWKIDHEVSNVNYIWCTPNEEPFNQLEKLPVKYSQKLLNSVFQDDYAEEKLNAFIDNFNLLYVTFTRPVEMLYAGCERNKKYNGKIKNVSDLILNALEKNDASIKPIIDYWDVDNKSFKCGIIEGHGKIVNDEKEIEIKYTSLPLYKRFKFTKQANDFFDRDSDANNKIGYGRLMHLIFQAIYTKKDIDKKILQFLFEGKINRQEADELKEKITIALDSIEKEEWFNGKYKVRNEQEIIVDREEVYRPDRVMEDNERIIVVDYKFGDREDEKHKKQVKHYMNLINEINKEKVVNGFVWYIDKNKMINVN